VHTSFMGSQATFKPPGFTVAVAKDLIESLMHIGDKFERILAEGKATAETLLNLLKVGETAFLMSQPLKPKMVVPSLPDCSRLPQI